MCRRYKKRPSEVIGIEFDEVLALDFDLAIMMRGIQNESDAMQRVRQRGNSRAALARLTERVERGEVQVVEAGALSLPGIDNPVQ